MSSFDSSVWRRMLRSGAQELGIVLPPDADQRMLRYVEILARWNRVFNLTAVRDPFAALSRHLLDSLAAFPYLQGRRILDVGSGAGLPGIPLALVSPEREFLLLDCSGKKARFLIQALAEIELGNAEVQQIRCEHYRPESGFDTVISRAFAPLHRLIATAGHLCAPEGRMLAMKGRLPRQELAGLAAGWEVLGVHRLAVPGLTGERHLIELAPTAAPDG